MDDIFSSKHITQHRQSIYISVLKSYSSGRSFFSEQVRKNRDKKYVRARCFLSLFFFCSVESRFLVLYSQFSCSLFSSQFSCWLFSVFPNIFLSLFFLLLESCFLVLCSQFSVSLCLSSSSFKLVAISFFVCDELMYWIKSLLFAITYTASTHSTLS